MSLPHPWRALRGMTEWTCRLESLPAGVLGLTDHEHRVILLARGMSQAQRRATLAHELQHARRGPVPACVEHIEEHEVDSAAARDLVPLELLLEHVVWARDLAELAEECWVDEATIRTRLAHLHPAERAALLEVVRRAEP